jgi:hypothetical protein
MLEFKEDTHEYFWDGRPVVSVTQVMDKVGMVSPFAKNERAALFGKALHKTIELTEKGEEVEYDPALEPWMESWRAYRDEWRAKGFGIIKEYQERPLYSDRYGYAGTPDVPFSDGKLIRLGDLKSGMVGATAEVQLAGYCQLLAENGFKEAREIERVALRVTDRGLFPEPFDRRNHVFSFNTFLSALNIYRWRQKHNLL